MKIFRDGKVIYVGNTLTCRKTPYSKHVFSLKGLNVRSLNCLTYAGITKISYLITLSEKELLKKKNIGKAVIKNIRFALQQIGKDLKPIESPYSHAGQNKKIVEMGK